MKILVLLAIFTMNTAMAKIITQKVEYKSGDLVFEGFLAFDDAQKGLRPGVMIVHNWKGVTVETESKAVEIAKLGYIAFAGDIYGKGVRPTDTKEAGALSGKYKSDVVLLRQRAMLAIDELKKNKKVDTKKIFVAGYCFGGTTALEVLRSGADVLGVISFHGGLATPAPVKENFTKAQALVLHGAIDPFVTTQEVTAFQKEMNDAKVNYQFISYSGAVHSFTEKAAGSDITQGAAYDEAADKRSFLALKNFLAELSK
jgi:dienelactone hydrolase